MDLALIQSNKVSTGIQASVNSSDVNVQTQLSVYEKVIYANLETNLKNKADLLEFGLENTIPTNSKELIEKAVQTKPDLHIDLSDFKNCIDKEQYMINYIFHVNPNKYKWDPLMLELDADLNQTCQDLGDIFLTWI